MDMKQLFKNTTKKCSAFGSIGARYRHPAAGTSTHAQFSNFEEIINGRHGGKKRVWGSVWMLSMVIGMPFLPCLPPMQKQTGLHSLSAKNNEIRIRTSPVQPTEGAGSGRPQKTDLGSAGGYSSSHWLSWLRIQPYTSMPYTLRSFSRESASRTEPSASMCPPLSNSARVP